MKGKEVTCSPDIHGKEVMGIMSTRRELLGRVFHILRENNPELAGDRRRTVMRPPQVLREATKKTLLFVNFMDLCRAGQGLVQLSSIPMHLMNRQPDHVMTFLLAEMGTSGSLDGQQRLVVKDEYVICNGCRSPDTILSKENRLFFLRCEQCGSGRSVAPIKAGFVARIGRRKPGFYCLFLCCLPCPCLSFNKKLVG